MSCRKPLGGPFPSVGAPGKNVACLVLPLELGPLRGFSVVPRQTTQMPSCLLGCSKLLSNVWTMAKNSTHFSMSACLMKYRT